MKTERKVITTNVTDIRYTPDLDVLKECVVAT